VPDGVLALVRPELASLRPYKLDVPDHVRVKLDANELAYPLSREISDDLSRYLSVIDLNRYPDAECHELRAVIAADLGVPPSSLVFGNGSDELIFLLCATFARPRSGQDRASVLYPVPTFSVFRTAALGAGLDPIEVPLGDEFEPATDAIDSALRERRPNIVFLARPNNPTGTLWPSSMVAELARRHADVLFVSDEAYVDFGGDSMVAMTSVLGNLVVLRTLSKIGLAALRVGYLHARQPIVDELEKIRAPYNIGALNQCAALFVLRHHRGLIRERCAEVVKERERVAREMRRLGGVHVYDSQANLLLFRVSDVERVWSGLRDNGVIVRRFAATSGRLGTCLRMTIGTPVENDEFLRALAKVL
jgi:histidinol-phosphate aminotransferase